MVRRGATGPLRRGVRTLSLVDEIRQLRLTGGKPFAAEAVAETTAAKFPEMRAINLDGVDVTLPSFFEKRVTLVAISMRQIGAEKLSSWIVPLAIRTCSSSRAKNHTKIVQLSVAESPVAHIFRSWFLSNLRRLETDPLLHHTTILRIGDSTVQRVALGMTNRLVGAKEPTRCARRMRRPLQATFSLSTTAAACGFGRAARPPRTSWLSSSTRPLNSSMRARRRRSAFDGGDVHRGKTVASEGKRGKKEHSKDEVSGRERGRGARLTQFGWRRGTWRLEQLVMTAAVQESSYPAEGEEGEESGLSYWLSGEQPKHAVSGLSQAVANIGAGVAGGVGTLLAMPILGAREEGATGFVKGLGAGVFGAVALPVLGVVSACKSLAEGVANTPAAVRACAEGKEWDTESNEWKWYDLRAEADEVLRPGAEDKFTERRRRRQERRQQQQASDASREAEPKPEKNVHDTALYDVLEVTPSASDGAIKKAYYRLALKFHPDKNPGDAEAQAKFQNIGQAYQVLSNPATRKTYDERGLQESEMPSHAMMDAATFFAIVFGSEAFELYVGELRLASTMKKSIVNGSSDSAAEDADIDHEELHFEQRRRVVKLALALADDLLAPFVDGSSDAREFERSIRSRGTELVGTPFGATLMRVIVLSYATAAERRLARESFSDDILLALRDAAHVAATKFDVVRDAARAVSRTRTAQVAEERCSRVRDAKRDDASVGVEEATIFVSARRRDERRFMIVVDKGAASKWQVMYFKREVQARVVWRNLSYQDASVLFERDYSDADDDFAWSPLCEYGAPMAVEGVRLVVAEATSQDDINATAAAEYVSRASHNQMMTALVETAWRLSVVDVESTLRAATHKVLNDHSVDEAVLLKRACALRIVAHVFDDCVRRSGHTESWQEQLARQIDANPPAPDRSPEAS